jgi:Fur family ferric uptake transcriptional regulator
MKNGVRKFQDFIQKYNLLWSTERKIIAEQVFDNHFHFTADDLFIQLNKKGKKISRATVYRTLNLLEKSGLLSKIQMQDGKHLYEHIYGHEHHDHLICQKCGKMIEFYSQDIENLQTQIASENGFIMTGHSLKIYGFCAECKNKVT